MLFIMEVHRPADELAWKYKLSGIFGYINYLVEKDRKYILNTLVNGEPFRSPVEGMPS